MKAKLILAGLVILGILLALPVFFPEAKGIWGLIGGIVVVAILAKLASGTCWVESSYRTEDGRILTARSVEIGHSRRKRPAAAYAAEAMAKLAEARRRPPDIYVLDNGAVQQMLEAKNIPK